MEMEVVQHCECTNCHWFIHFTLIHFVLNSFSLTLIKESTSKGRSSTNTCWMNEQQINEYAWPWKQFTLKCSLWKNIVRKSVVLCQPHLNYSVWGKSRHLGGCWPGSLWPWLVALAVHGEWETKPGVQSGGKKKTFCLGIFRACCLPTQQDTSLTARRE